MSCISSVGTPFKSLPGLEQLLEFATQDADPSRFYPLREPIAQKASELKQRLAAAEPGQINALLDFASRAFRRPLEPHETDNLRSLFATLRAEEIPHDEAFKLVLARVFASPDFLYRAENPAPRLTAGPGQPMGARDAP